MASAPWDSSAELAPWDDPCEWHFAALTVGTPGRSRLLQCSGIWGSSWTAKLLSSVAPLRFGRLGMCQVLQPFGDLFKHLVVFLCFSRIGLAHVASCGDLVTLIFVGRTPYQLQELPPLQHPLYSLQNHSCRVTSLYHPKGTFSCDHHSGLHSLAVQAFQ